MCHPFAAQAAFELESFPSPISPSEQQPRNNREPVVVPLPACLPTPTIQALTYNLLSMALGTPPVYKPAQNRLSFWSPYPGLT